MREAQGILLKNENGELMITKDTLDNMVKKAVVGFEEVKDCKAKISINQKKSKEKNKEKMELFGSVGKA